MEISKIIKINDVIARLYHHILVSTKAGQKAMEYLHSRKVNDSTINAYELGWAPKESIVVRYCSKYGVTPEQLRATGLTAEGKNGKLYDRFFDRIMYPIADRYGHVIAFSGRVLDKKDSIAKYLNIPETRLFHKRQTIFNLDKAAKSIKAHDRVILVEGYMDVISAHQAGVDNVVASMGTSLTGPQIDILKQFTDNITVCYDGDEPGQDAIARAMHILSGNGIDRSVIQMPAGIDPDEYRRQFGNKAFQNYMKSHVESPAGFWLNRFNAEYIAADKRAAQLKGLTDLSGVKLMNYTKFMDKAIHLISGFTVPKYCRNLSAALLVQFKYVDELHKLSAAYSISLDDIYSNVFAMNYRDGHDLSSLLNKAELGATKIILIRPELLTKLNLGELKGSVNFVTLLDLLKLSYQKYGRLNHLAVVQAAKRCQLTGMLKRAKRAYPVKLTNHLIRLYFCCINHCSTIQSRMAAIKSNLKLASQLGDKAGHKALRANLNVFAKSI